MAEFTLLRQRRPRSFPEPDSATLEFHPQIQTHPATYLHTPDPLPDFWTPEFPPPDQIFTKPVGTIPTDPARPGAPDHTEDLAGGDTGVNLSRVKPETPRYQAILESYSVSPAVFLSLLLVQLQGQTQGRPATYSHQHWVRRTPSDRRSEFCSP